MRLLEAGIIPGLRVGARRYRSEASGQGEHERDQWAGKRPAGRGVSERFVAVEAVAMKVAGTGNGQEVSDIPRSRAKSTPRATRLNQAYRDRPRDPLWGSRRQRSAMLRHYADGQVTARADSVTTRITSSALARSHRPPRTACPPSAPARRSRRAPATSRVARVAAGYRSRHRTRARPPRSRRHRTALARAR